MRNQDEEAGEAAFEVGRFTQGGDCSASLALGDHHSGGSPFSLQPTRVGCHAEAGLSARNMCGRGQS
jgi:hypothetical protein